MNWNKRVEKYLSENPDRAIHFKVKEKNIDWKNPNIVRKYRRQQRSKKYPTIQIFGDRNPDYCIKWTEFTLQSHKTRKFIISITYHELLNLVNTTHFCKYCGIKLNWSGDKSCSNSPTLDRRNGEITLTINNVDIICRSCNGSKQQHTEDEFWDIIMT